MERDTRLKGIFMSLDISLFIFPSESLVREPPPYSLTGSPWTDILCHQSHWSIYSFIHSFMYVCQNPQNAALLHRGKNIRSPSTEHHTDRRHIYNGVWLGSPKGSLATLQSLHQCHAAFGMIPSTLAWVDHSPISQLVL